MGRKKETSAPAEGKDLGTSVGKHCSLAHLHSFASPDRSHPRHKHKTKPKAKNNNLCQTRPSGNAHIHVNLREYLYMTFIFQASGKMKNRTTRSHGEIFSNMANCVSGRRLLRACAATGTLGYSTGSCCGFASSRQTPIIPLCWFRRS